VQACDFGVSEVRVWFVSPPRSHDTVCMERARYIDRETTYRIACGNFAYNHFRVRP
jgi:hypothetical protein